MSNLTPGQTVTINVEVSGIGTFEELFFLGADVILPASIFGVPTTPVSGAAVPGPMDFVASAFTALPDQVATAFYDDFGSGSITSNDVFFSFDATVIGTGIGEVQFDPGSPPQVFGFKNDTFTDIDVVAAGDPLQFTSSQQTSTPVPEPASWLIWGVLGAALLGCTRLYSVVA